MIKSILRLRGILRLGLICLIASSGFVAQGATAGAKIGQAVTLSVSVSGTAPFTYKWLKNGVVLTGATASTYLISSFQAASAGVYSAIISNAAGSTVSDGATLVVATLPVITTQPLAKTMVVGGGVSFLVTATGTPTLTYQWRKNGTAITGATGSTYVIASVAASQAGTYSVLVKNAAGTVTSANAALTVTSPTLPVITTQPTAKTVVAGGSVTFAVAATGSPSPTYQWRKNGTAITGATGGTYALTGVTTAQAGTYSVLVKNSAGTVTSANATLTVTNPTLPMITTQPTAKTVVAGGSATFAVTATGSPTPTYQWRKNGTAITGATSSTYALAGVTTAQAGTYSVLVKNSAGTVTSANAALTVNTLPVITTQPAGKTVVAGASVTLSVAATGLPAPTYQWRKNGTAIAGATGGSYVLTGVTTTQAGTYSVVVSNSVGTATSSNAVLKVNPPLPVHADFNGDRKSDILWQNVLTGEHRVWLMTGTVLTSTVPLNTMGTDWEVIGASDFNLDGKNDVLWQNLVTRESALWFMAGTTMAGGVSLGAAPAGMLMAGTADFSADGMPDILWQNVSTGAYSIRLMNGTVAGTSVSIGAGPAGWMVGGTGDFNGDGKPDILWQRLSDGAARVWLMNGSVYVSATDLGAMGAGWNLGGTGDFNGDGKTDILWRHSTTGARKIALMSGLTKTSEVSLGTGPVEWIMVN